MSVKDKEISLSQLCQPITTQQHTIFMKKLVYMALSLIALSGNAFVPEVAYQPRFMSIDSISCSPQSTRLSVTLTHYPNYWVKIDSLSVLTDEATGRSFPIIGQENLPLSQEIWMPESGEHSGVLIFPPLPSDVVSLTFSEPGSKPENKVIGLRLDRERQSVGELRGMSREDVLAQSAPQEKWNGLDPGAYAQMEFYKPGSRTILQGRMANVPPGHTTTLRTTNYLTGKDDVTLVEFDSVGNFCEDLPVVYPQIGFMDMGRSMIRVMLCPGDTCELYTSMRTKFNKEKGSFEPEYFRVGGNNHDATAISCLIDDVKSRFVDPRADYQWWIQKVKGGLDSIMDAAAGIKADFPGIISRAKTGINQYPISPQAKDLLFTYALVKNYMPLADMELYWRDNQYLRTQTDKGHVLTPNPDYVPIDAEKYYGGQEAYQNLIYDNALVLCADYIFLNRAQFSPLFSWQNMAVDGLKTLPDFGGNLNELSFGGEELPYPLIKRFEQQREQAIGLGDCFVQQFVIAEALISSLKTWADYNDESLEANAKLLADLLPMIKCRRMGAEVVGAYGSVAKEYGRKIGGAGGARVVDVDSDVLATITDPYAGRVIYVDVWNITCGPCRAGIINQKPILQKYADEAVTVIYLAPEDSKDRCEAWLAENDVKGEHVYLSDAGYKRLCADFNILGIPFGILIDKQGRVREEGLHSLDEVKLESLLKE